MLPSCTAAVRRDASCLPTGVFDVLKCVLAIDLGFGLGAGKARGHPASDRALSLTLQLRGRASITSRLADLLAPLALLALALLACLTALAPRGAALADLLFADACLLLTSTTSLERLFAIVLGLHVRSAEEVVEQRTQDRSLASAPGHTAQLSPGSTSATASAPGRLKGIRP